MNNTNAIKFLNALGEIKNELVGIRNLSETREERDVEVIFLTIPEAGGVRQFQIGTTSIDFKTGVIINPDGSKEYLNLTLDTFQYLFARSLTIDTNQDILLRILPFKRYTVKADITAQIEYLTYNKIEITCTQLTNIKIWASTHPRNVVSEFKGAANLTQTNIDGDLIEAQTYDTVYSLLNNLNRIRNRINNIKGTTNWYDDTPVDLTDLWDSSLSAVKLSNIYHIAEEYSNHLGAVDNFTETTTTGSGTATADATNHEMDLSGGNIPYGGTSSFLTKASYTLGTKPIIVNIKLNNVETGIIENGALVTFMIGLLDPTSFNTDVKKTKGCTFIQLSGLGGGESGLYIHAGNGSDGTKVKLPSGLAVNGDLITIIATSTSAKYYINGILQGTISTYFPTTAVKIGAYINNYYGPGGFITTPISLSVDYLNFKVYK